MLSALTLGDKSHLDKNLKGAYSLTGASHVLAVSGLHVGVVFIFSNFFLGLIFIRKFKRWRYLPLLFVFTNLTKLLIEKSLLILLDIYRKYFIDIGKIVLAAEIAFNLPRLDAVTFCQKLYGLDTITVVDTVNGVHEI